MLESTARNYRYYEVLQRDIVQTDNNEKDELFLDDLITHISFFLDNKTLGKSLQINKNWLKTVANSPTYQDRLWERNFRRQFEINISKPTNLNWRDFYVSYEKKESKKSFQQLLDKLNRTPNGYEKIYGKELFCRKTADLGLTEDQKLDWKFADIWQLVQGIVIPLFICFTVLTFTVLSVEKNFQISNKTISIHGTNWSIFTVIYYVVWSIFNSQFERRDIAYDKTYSWHRTVKHLAIRTQEVISESLGNK